MTLLNDGQLDINQLELLTKQRSALREVQLRQHLTERAMSDLNSSWKEANILSYKIGTHISELNYFTDNSKTRKVLKYLDTYSLEPFTDELRNHLGPIIAICCDIIYDPQTKTFSAKLPQDDLVVELLPVKRKWYDFLLNCIPRSFITKKRA